MDLPSSSQQLGELTVQPAAASALNCSLFPPLHSPVNSTAASPEQLFKQSLGKRIEAASRGTDCQVLSACLRLRLSQAPCSSPVPTKQGLLRQEIRVLLSFNKIKKNYNVKATHTKRDIIQFHAQLESHNLRCTCECIEL